MMVHAIINIEGLVLLNINLLLILQMIYYEKIGNSEGIDINKMSASKECSVCYFRVF